MNLFVCYLFFPTAFLASIVLLYRSVYTCLDHHLQDYIYSTAIIDNYDREKYNTRDSHFDLDSACHSLQETVLAMAQSLENQCITHVKYQCLLKELTFK